MLFSKFGFGTGVGKGEEGHHSRKDGGSYVRTNSKKDKYKNSTEVIKQLRKKIASYRRRLAYEAAVNEELGRRVTEYKIKYEREREERKTLAADSNTWRKFATTLQCSNHGLSRNSLVIRSSPNNKPTRTHNSLDRSCALSPSSASVVMNPSMMPEDYPSPQLGDNHAQRIRAVFEIEWNEPSCGDNYHLENSLFDHFLISGAPSMQTFEAFDATPRSKRTLSKCRSVVPPKILYGFGNRATLPVSVEDFCFPSGIEPKIVKLTESATELNHVLFGNSSVIKLGNTHMFKLIGAVESNPEAPLFGYCVQVHRLIEVSVVILYYSRLRRRY
jgi:hypothetical protein